MTILHLDYEVRSPVEIKKRGLDRYSNHPETQVTLASYQIDGGAFQTWDYFDGYPFPRELAEALEDPYVQKWAFNAQFERVITKNVLKIDTPIENWRCVMVLSYLQSFTGKLGEVAVQMRLPTAKIKFDGGQKLIDTFCKPQRITKANPHLWRTPGTDPALWEAFKEYNRQDVIAEEYMHGCLRPFFIPDDEWDFYELDQIINDRGIPMDMQFVENAIKMVERRKAELFVEMRALSGVDNPNSTQQVLPWLKGRGYPFDDLQADTVQKVLNELEAGLTYDSGPVDDECIKFLQLRQKSARQSVSKYNKVMNFVGADGRLRYVFQFAGASRTARFAGRTFQPTNLPRTPKLVSTPKPMIKMGWDEDAFMDAAVNTIREGDYELMRAYPGEMMDYLVGLLRAAIRAH